MSTIFVSSHPLKDALPHCYRNNFVPASLGLQTIIKSVWAPAIYKGGIRLEKMWLNCAIAALDFDDGMSLETALETFKDYAHIIATTKSHGIKGDRFRVILFFELPISNLELYKHNMKILTDKFGADKACKDGARFFYPCKDSVSVRNGAKLPVLPLPIVSKMPVRTSIRNLGRVTPAAEGARNRCTFAAACRFLKLGLDDQTICDKLRVVSNGLSESEVLKIFNSAKSAVKS
jgi:hypothetical protein